MVTATTGIAYFKGKSGRIYTPGIYISDVIGAAVTFALSGAAGTGSLQYFRAPEPVVLFDMAIVTGPTVATGVLLTQDGANVAGTNTLISTQLTTLATRGSLAVAFPAGALVGATQF